MKELVVKGLPALGKLATELPTEMVRSGGQILTSQFVNNVSKTINRKNSTKKRQQRPQTKIKGGLKAKIKGKKTKARLLKPEKRKGGAKGKQR